MPEDLPDKATELEALYTEMALHHVEGLWRVSRKGPDVQPYLWKWPLMERLVRESGRLVEIDRPGERRAVALCNPGLPDAVAATHTLYAAIQLVRPGEVARAHRHSPSALRFIIRGQGSSTIVEGEKIPMNDGDLVLTPNWMWHEHRNEGDEDVLWLDGLDSPFVFSLSAAIYEPYPGDAMEVTKPLDHSGRAFGLGTVRPVGYSAPSLGSSLLVYRWPATLGALEHLADLGSATPWDGVAIEYVNTDTGGHTLSTMSCWMQMLRPNEHTQAHRHTHSSVYHVFRGQGYTVIDGKRFVWAQGDSFVVPPWAWHEHANASSNDAAFVFSMNDLPIMESFKLEREEAFEANGGRQHVLVDEAGVR
ncbi:MAG: cupin domain-containing protein [Dehalococcoidia bacterium]